MRAILPLFLLSIGAIEACGDSVSAPAVPPVTGVLVRSDSLLAKHGCGDGDTQVYRYVATVVDANGANVAGQVVDCFADAAFVNLPPAAGSESTSYGIAIFAFNASTYTAKNANGQVDASASNLASMQQIAANFTTKCTVVQITNVQTAAECEPLLPSP